VYILHNVERYVLRNLNVDIENAGLKIYVRFSISVNRRETLQDFNAFANTELLEFLHQVSASWLSLLPRFETHTCNIFCSNFWSRQTNCTV